MCVCICVCTYTPILIYHSIHSNIAAEHMLYDDKDIEASMDRIETVNFHEVCLRIYNIYIYVNIYICVYIYMCVCA